MVKKNGLANDRSNLKIHFNNKHKIMSQDKTNQNLFEDFSPISTEQWVEKIKTDLKGADYHKRLFWNSP